MKKVKWKKKAKIKLSILVCFFTRLYLATLKVYTNLETLALTSVTETLIGEKEKWTNKSNDKKEEADFLLHDI